jgi:nucleoside-diphosphate-sugar epimerase
LKVLVTGASGFVGSALARRLLRDGLQVRGTHRRVPPPAIPGIEWHQLSRLDSEPALRDVAAGCDAVVHLAALAHQTGKSADGRRDEFERVNVESTRLLARAARSLAVHRFVFVSSVAAVCSSSDVCVDEQTPARPDTDYGRSKLHAEQALQKELQDGSTDWCVLRPPLVYGPGNPGNMGRLMRLIEHGLPLPFGSIRNRRSFIFIDNLVDALATVVTHPGEIRSIYFVGDGSDFSTPELAVSLAAAARRPTRLLHVPVGILELLGRVGDGIERLLGVSAGIDSYSVDRLVGSMAVSGALFCRTFRWQAPVGWADALRITGSAPAVSQV